MTTVQRIESELWWPTMSTASPEAYAGSGECTGCHSEESSPVTPTSMQRAAMRAEAKKDGLFHHVASTEGGAGTSFAADPLTYVLRQQDATVAYAVSDGKETATQDLDWVMGAGELGQTFVYRRENRWFQSRMSVYAKALKLDVTTGLKVDAGMDLSTALGERLTTEEVRHCFSCHTVAATTSRGFNPGHAEAGLGCEACHGPGASHGKTMGEGGTRRPGAAIFNPARLPAADSIDFCGACHRTYGDVGEMKIKVDDRSVVRFQPYRLEKSRCWRETQDARVTCVGCHDPHEPLNRADASYDGKCLRCHAGGTPQGHGGRVCATGAKALCVSCHMPKVAVASMHGEFTDHLIRVVRPGEGFVP